MAPLANIALLVLFAIVIFAIIGLEVYNGEQFHNACRYLNSDGKLCLTSPTFYFTFSYLDHPRCEPFDNLC